MGTAERRERDREQMRRRILDTAMALFVDEGYDKVSIRRIAEKIEYSPATIYLYFEDKNDILYRLHEEGFAELLRHMEQVMPIKNPRQRLLKLGEVYIKFAMQNREYYNLMFIMEGPVRQIKQEWQCGFDAFNALRQTVAECISQRYINYPNADVVAVAIWSYVHGLSSLIIRDRFAMFDESQLPSLIQGALDFFDKVVTNTKE